MYGFLRLCGCVYDRLCLYLMTDYCNHNSLPSRNPFQPNPTKQASRDNDTRRILNHKYGHRK